MPDIRLILGDCRDVLPTLADGIIDFVCTDPPYGIRNNDDGDLISVWERATNKQRRNGLGHKVTKSTRPIANDGEEAEDLFKLALKQFRRLLIKGGCAAVCSGGGGPDPLFARWSLWMSKALDLKQMVVWDKGPMGMGWHYRRSYETVLVAQKPGAPCKWYDTTSEVENIIRPGAYGIKKIIPSKREHPVPKPVALAMHFIRLHTREGETVLDPFMGAGWVAVACKELNRNFIGIEVEPKWHALAEKRVTKMRKGFLGYREMR